jgi:hypothetical protein
MADKDNELPPDAQKLVKGFEREVEDIWERAGAEIDARRDQLVEGLQALRDTHAKAGRFDEALAVHERIRQLKAGATAGQTAEVEWFGMWWEAEVLEVKGGRYYIRYNGWGDAWNEWVGRERIRFPAGRERPPGKGRSRQQRRA